MFKNMKLRTKLLGGFILVAFITVIVGIFGIINLKQADESDTILFERNCKPLVDIGQISTAFQRIRVNSRDVIMYTDDANMQRCVDNIDKYWIMIDSDMSTLDMSITREDIKALIKSLKEGFDKYKLVVNKVVELGHQNKNAEATALLQAKANVELANNLVTGSIRMMDLLEKYANERSINNTKNANQTITISIIVMIVGFLIAILLGFIINKNVLNQLGGDPIYVLEITNKVAIGDLSMVIDLKGKKETSLIFKMDIMIKAIKALVNDAAKLSEAAIAGKLDTRADANKHQGDYKAIVDGVNKTLDNVIGPLNVAAEYVDRISKGDIPPRITDKYNGDFNEIKNNLNQCIDAVNLLVADSKMLSNAAEQGKLDTRADALKHYGDFRAIVNGVNSTLDNVIGPLNVAAEYVDRISKGDIPPKINDNYNGDFNEIKNNLNSAIDVMNGLLVETNMLIQATKDGKLDKRGQADKFSGDWGTLVNGINDLITAFVAPINVTAEYVDRIAKGDIPPKITEIYYGDFNEIKNNLNSAIDVMNGLLAETNMLIQATKEGKLDKRGKADKFTGGWGTLVSGVNDLITAFVAPINVTAEYVDRIAKGDIPPKITDIYQGDFNEIKNNLNQCIDAINLMVQDSKMLVNAAIVEKFDTRADITHHNGDFKKIVEGVNQTLDVIVNKIFWFEQLLDAIPNPVSVTDLDMNWTFINKAAEGVAGKTRKEIIGKHCSNWGADICGTEKCGIHGLRNGKATSFFNQPGLDMDFKVDSAYILNAKGERIGHIEVVNDITEVAKKAEYNKFEIERVSKNLKLISEGVFTLDLIPAESNQYTKSEKENFIKIYNDLEVAKNSILALVNDSILLSNAAIEGKLDTRANSNNHKGDYKRIITGVNTTLDNVIGPLNVAAEYVDRISKGDIPPKITDKYNGDFNEIKNNLNQCIDAVNLLVSDAAMLTKAAEEGKLDTRADTMKHSGDFRAIVDGVNKTLDNVIGPLNVAAEYVDRISKGDIPPKITDKYNGDFNEIKNNLNQCIDAVNLLVLDTIEVSKGAAEGNLEIRADAFNHGGKFRAIIDGINNTLDNLTDPLNVAAEYVDRIANGDIPPKITENYFGDFNIIKNNLNKCIDAINLLVEETGILTKSSIEGKLDVRANALKHNGEYRTIIEGINKTLDNVISPLNVAAEYVDRISKGDIPPKITENYNGDFNEIKNNLNSAIDVMNGLLAETNMLIQATKEGKLDIRGQANKFTGGWGSLVAGINDLITAFVAPINVTAEYVNRISKGDIPPKITDTYHGDFNEIKNNLNQCIDAVDLLVADAVMLAKAAEEGKLSTRAEAMKHGGDFRAIVDGVNKTLDYVIEPINEAGKVLEVMSTGNLTVRMQGDYKGDNQKLKNSINAFGNSLTDVIVQVNDTVQTSASSAFEISSTAESLAAASQEQSAQADEVAGAVEEMSRTVSENAMSANRTADLARKSGEIATNGANVVKQTVNKMKDIADVVQTSANNIQKLGDSSKEIGEIISVIDDIADQTNLLALNAAIEAARAGEQGRGFAVVADEVRKLAERTTEATKQIAKMIKGIQKETDQAVVAMNRGTLEVQNGIDLADKAGESLNHILTSTQDVLDMINQIAAASEEQSATSEQISKNVMSISKVTGESAQRIEDVARTSDELAKLTEQLRNLMSQFQVEGNDSYSYSPTKQFAKKERKHLHS